MDLGDLLQGVGIFVCIGAVLLAVLVFVGIRRAFASRPPRQIEGDAGVMRDRTYNQPYEAQRGTERPRYDSDRVESSGGFGGARTYDDSRRGRDLDDRLDRDLDRGPDRDLDQDLPRRRDRDDDDDVRSSGGFGG